jgi:hypothetical protein
MGHGTHLSGRILTAEYGSGTLQDTASHLIGDRGAALKEFFQAIIVFQLLEQFLDRKACAINNPTQSPAYFERAG